jgi:NAD(P)-dependent dehydrogenase (short-subunit alcohol dehydrogenase family)
VAIVAAGLGGGLVGGALLGALTGGVAWGLQPWVDEQVWSMRGKVCVLTGATSGIGYEVARGLARMGATLVLLVRDRQRGERARAAITAETPGASLQVLPCDLSSLRSVSEAAEAIRARFIHVDLLVHDAGASFPQRTLTTDGIEGTLAVDVVGPFALTMHLLDRLEGGRVITLAGIYQRRAEVVLDDLGFARRRYHWLAASNQAQRGRVLFTAELARRALAVTAVAVHPGAVLTAAQGQLPRLVRLLIHTLLRPGFVRAELGALPVLRLAAQPRLDVSGRFFDRFRLAPDRPDPALAGRFWEACEKLAGLHQRGAQEGPLARQPGV